MSGKIHPKKPIGGTQFGTTIHDSDPAKFPNKGKEHGKMDSSKTVRSQEVGATFTKNDPAISFPEASEYGKGKSMGQKSKPAFVPSEKPRSANDAPVHTGCDPLKRSYEK